VVEAAAAVMTKVKIVEVSSFFIFLLLPLLPPPPPAALFAQHTMSATGKVIGYANAAVHRQNVLSIYKQILWHAQRYPSIKRGR
jgi:hypothetical protein